MFDLETILTAIAPEVLLAAAGLLGVTIGAFLGDRFNGLSFKFGALVLFAAAALAGYHWEGGRAFDGLVETSSYANFAKVVSFVSGGIALLMAEGFLRRHETLRYEYSLLIIFAALGMGMILSSANFMTLYLGVETLSLSSYVLASFHRDSPRSSEAGLKYFVLGALASGLLLYGMSLVYGFSGSTSYEIVAEAEPTMGLLFGMVLMITGLAFKVSAAPMHVWTPDVYEGSPSPVVAFFATAPKMASMVVFAIVLYTAFPQVTAFENWQVIVGIIAAASMIVGAFGALPQTNLKRLLGYSSIANMGYALVAVAAGVQYGAGSLLIFMTAYVIASLGLFGGVLSMRREGGMVEDINELAGLVRRQPGLASALTLLLVSVSGFPLAFGFLGKLAVIQAGVSSGMWPLVIILVLSSVIAMYYYLRIVKIMWFDEQAEDFEPVDGWVTTTVYISALVSVALLIFVAPFSELAETVAAGLIS
ncbi:MAG: NADH-quinone oxidoreductase subunit NuoN [Hyphomonas sp.]|jgi:NADH-quinone oxidoreductase subunit N|nr:NADH-quinone oxidoreductase subunit NuoN [Henriciella sp.]MBO6696781.1 NADH-quinone oxidoreductase subunit NuoN [Henriciella sp.]MCR9223593.1 NADH-quinone oxidoreductase subunit NuoN [Hyphomonas sp.]